MRLRRHARWGLLAGGLLLAACSPKSGAGETRNDLDAAPKKTTALSVRVIQAQPGTLSVQRTASATIQAKRDSRVAAQTGGTVQAVLVGEGEQVAAAQVVLQLDDTPARQALENAQLQLRQAQISLQQTRTNSLEASAALRAAVTSAEASLAQAKASAQSAENLYTLGGISQADLQAARAGLAQAQSTLAQARTTLAQNGRSAQSSVPLGQAQVDSAQASVRQAQANLSRTSVRAPFAGTVVDLNVEVGEFAAQGSPVFRLVDPSSIRVKFSVPTADAATLKDGTTLNLGYAGVNYVATVEGSPGIAGTDRLVPITARVQGGTRLPVGGSAQARYRATLGRGVLIPSTSVQVDGGENAVYTVSGAAAQRQVVRVIAESGGQLAVSGLEVGAQVINPVPASIQDGASVKVDQ